MSGVEFVDGLPGDTPMQSRVHRERIREFAAELRKQPGRWAIYPWTTTDSGSRATASRISRGKVVAFGDGFRAVSSHGTVYVQYREQGR